VTTTDRLSIAAAAREAPHRPAIITADRTITFADAAAGARAHRGADHAIVAHPSIDTLLQIYAALDEHRAIALCHPRAQPPPRAAVPAGTLAVLYTSGSTAAPRGVILSRAAFVAADAASAAHLGGHDDRWLLCLSLAHTGGLAVALRALAARRPVILHHGPSFDPAKVARLAVAAGATAASLVPTQLDALVAAAAPLPPWRLVLVGGAAAPPSVVARAAARGVPVLRTYGLTETWGQVATQRLADAGRPDAPMIPLAGITVAAGTAAAPAAITIAGPTLMTGYVGAPPLAGPLVTSDLGYLDATGGLHVVGRCDDVIITGGENVHPAQVEAAVAAAPGVAAACAFGVPDERWGALVACAIVLHERLDLAALHAWLAAHLPPHLRPRRLAVVDALPLGPTGKVDRRALATQLLD
jgi:o-succinylbenzoate---CoA ligase